MGDDFATDIHFTKSAISLLKIQRIPHQALQERDSLILCKFARAGFALE